MLRTTISLPLITAALLGTSIISGCGPIDDDQTPFTGGTNAGVGGTAGNTGGGGGGTASGGATGAEPMTDACGAGTTPFTVYADEANNMTLTSSLTLNTQVVAGNTGDLTFDWSGVTTDFFGHAIDWNDIKIVSLVVWQETPEMIAEMINADDPDLEAKVLIPVKYVMQPGATSATLSEFVDAGDQPLVLEDVRTQYLDPALGYTYTVIVQDEEGVGFGARMIQAFTVDAAATETTVTLSDTSTALTAMATFGTPVSVPAGTADINIDYSTTIATRSFGGVFDPGKISEVIVGQYDPATNIEANILDVETAYTNIYRGNVIIAGSLNLSALADEAGNPFPGIDAGSQWLVGLVATGNSRNPTPLYLAELTPCP